MKLTKKVAPPLQAVISANTSGKLGVTDGVLVTDGVAVIEILGVGVGEGHGLLDVQAVQVPSFS